MENICRLCGKKKTPKQLAHTIGLNVEQKLIECCRWNSLVSREYDELMPKSICMACFRQLENSWSFAESVAEAQQKLLSIVAALKPPTIEYVNTSNVKAETDDQIDSYMDDNNQDDWVETNEPDELNAHNLHPNLKSKYEIEENKISSTSPIIDSDSDADSFQSPELQNDNDISESEMDKSNAKKEQVFESKPRKPQYGRKKTDAEVQRKRLQKLPPSLSRLCDTCGVEFSSLNSLRRHRMIHLGKTPHECKTCGKQFRTTYSLQVE